MPRNNPETVLDSRYSDSEAEALEWPEAARRLAEAELFWVTTLRPDGRPHMTPLLAVWHGGALHFTTGPDERKARNLARHPQCALATGNDLWEEGVGLVVEGEAERVRDTARLSELAEAWAAKYGERWRFAVADGAFVSEPAGRALVFAVAPRVAYGFAKGPFGQTRWRF
ncbi:pyridoxamine 5'-phosphate oxidase family protein [Streptomyces boncukensis]|uniref:Pyridoxamine 5'-phosphate oxidase family protein n=1 Tax=Streptomyces boncukensis TaxID=2711219 RepID=A0A6G4X1D1_9ACTN|nr:pyridoxamine 5'-phosphate oxidase family protein [Streptomyces boncukensis]NGO70932.1 pyridoxamine 5'-phosphate oxidase family protein [Streptomyces boncukensis]